LTKNLLFYIIFLRRRNKEIEKMKRTENQPAAVDYKSVAHILWCNVSGDTNRKLAAKGLVDYLSWVDPTFEAEEFTRILTTGR
jgi:hypothetical protein